MPLTLQKELFSKQNGKINFVGKTSKSLYLHYKGNYCNPGYIFNFKQSR